MDKEMRKIMKFIAREEVKAYSNTSSMILKASLSVRADYQEKGEHNNFVLFNHKEAVTRVRDNNLLRDVYFTLN